MYAEPPGGEISIEEFEELALDRLTILKRIENYLARNEKIPANIDDSLAMHSNQSNFKLSEERRKDYISHYLQRLAFCSTEHHRQWFIANEIALFRTRFLKETAKDRKDFISHCDIEYPSFDGVYHVPFENVLDLVSKRLVTLKNGMAFVQPSDAFSIILNKFRKDLEDGLKALSKVLPRLNESDRLVPLINGLVNYDVAETTSGTIEGTLMAADVDKQSKHFPPCMSRLHSSLQRDSHLKHGGRMQFGLFLKSIGLSMNEALIYFKKAFSRKFTEEQFQKSYAYNIRHNYGEEGKRVSYTPFSCHRIITYTPGLTGVLLDIPAKKNWKI